jgi:hypothetical protein
MYWSRVPCMPGAGALLSVVAAEKVTTVLFFEGHGS